MSEAIRDVGATCIRRNREPLRDVIARVSWLHVGAGFLLAYGTGALCALIVYGTGLWNGGGWETAAVVAAQRTVNPVLDPLMLTLPLFGTNYTLAPIVLIAAIILVRRGYPTVAVHLAVVQAGSWLLNPLLKFSFPRDRPELFEARGQHAFPAFPSGHAIAAVAVLLTIAYLVHRCGRGAWMYWVVGGYILFNAYSRIYLAVHWPTDVIAGAIVGGVWLGWTLFLFRDVHPYATPVR